MFWMDAKIFCHKVFCVTFNTMFCSCVYTRNTISMGSIVYTLEWLYMDTNGKYHKVYMFKRYY